MSFANPHVSDTITEEQEQEASELHNLAESIILECKQDSAHSSLDSAIFLLRHVLDQQPLSDPTRSDTIHCLSTILLTRFHQRGWIEDFHEAWELIFKTINAMMKGSDVLWQSNTSGHDQTSDLLERSEAVQLARDILADFQQSVERSSIDTAVRLYRDALLLRHTANQKRISTLTALADSLVMRFQVTNRLEDLDEAIVLSREALHSLLPPDPARYRLIIYHCANLCTRIGCTSQMQDILDAVEVRSEAKREDEEASESLSGGTDMLKAFQLSGNVSDLNSAVSLLYTSLWLRPAPHPLRSLSLNVLGCALSTRFEQNGHLADLEESIALHREAVGKRPASHPHRSDSLNNLANALLTRFEQKGQLADLEESIAFNRETLDERPAPHPDRSVSLNNLANAILTKFEQNGQLADLEESISLHREALDLSPGPGPDRSIPLDNIANSLVRRFEQKGQLADLEESIACRREALDLRPAPNPLRSDALNNLAGTLLTQFKQKGQLADLEESIVFLREALDLRPAPHPRRCMSLNNLAGVLFRRFEHKGQLADLEESIAFHREALDLVPAPHPLQSLLINNIASSLSRRFEQKGQLTDLEESITFHRMALGLRPAPHPDRSMSLNNLASALSERFENKGQLTDLEESIVCFREALDLRPADHPDRSGSLNNLADVLSRLFEQNGQLTDLEESMSAYRDATTCTTGSVIQRFRSSRIWANRSDMFHHSSTLEAYQQATDLLPRLASLDMTLKARHEALSLARGLACDACAFAIRIGQLEKAVEFISAGRTVFWSQALQLRTPLDNLESDEPILAQKLRSIAHALEQASVRDASQTLGWNSEAVRDMEKESSRCRVLSEEWNHTLVEVRKHGKYKHFLQPQPFCELQQAACNGPVVILNSSKSGCDALLITQDGVHHVSLPPAFTLQVTHELGVTLREALSPSMTHSTSTHASYDNLYHLVRETGTADRKASRVSRPGRDSESLFRLVLKVLWLHVAQPVVRALHLQKSNSPTRLWWCPTGPFAFLPIHAAGIYDGEEFECLSDYAISSYTPTLEALLVPPPPTVHPFKMLVVIQPEMRARPGHSLPYASKELERIQRHVPNQSLITFGTGEAPTSVAKVLPELSRVSLAHFACHGTQNLVNPLESALLLDDDDLKASKIMEQYMPNASLAFLSACETAKGDERTPDEVVHLSATMLFAGFRGVVGTMWSIFDEDAPEVADVFYGHLCKNDLASDPHIDITEAALALHLAVKKLRVEKKVTFRRWVPFIHLGV